MKKIPHLKEKEPQIEVDIDLRKVSIFILVFLSFIIIAAILISRWFDKNRLDFRTPVVLQNPVLISKRKPKTVTVTVEKIKTVSVEKTVSSDSLDEVSEYIPSANTLKLIEKFPSTAGKIKKHFKSEWRKAAEIIGRESSFQNDAVNASSGACGLGQFYPCSKLNCSLKDVDCQLAEIKAYIHKRYGTVSAALAFHDKNGWY
jgi:hypothetical protein